MLWNLSCNLLCPIPLIKVHAPAGGTCMYPSWARRGVVHKYMNERRGGWMTGYSSDGHVMCAWTRKNNKSQPICEGRIEVLLGHSTSWWTFFGWHLSMVLISNNPSQGQPHCPPWKSSQTVLQWVAQIESCKYLTKRSVHEGCVWQPDIQKSKLFIYGGSYVANFHLGWFTKKGPHRSRFPFHFG